MNLRRKLVKNALLAVAALSLAVPAMATDDTFDFTRNVNWTLLGPAYSTTIGSAGRCGCTAGITGLDLGIQGSKTHDGITDLAYADVVRDGHGKSLLTGVAREWLIGNLDTVAFSGGVTAGIWYRPGVPTTLAFPSQNFTPYLVPILSAVDSHSGFGAHMLVIPTASIGGARNSVPTLMLQATLQLN